MRLLLIFLISALIGGVSSFIYHGLILRSCTMNKYTKDNTELVITSDTDIYPDNDGTSLEINLFPELRLIDRETKKVLFRADVRELQDLGIDLHQLTVDLELLHRERY